MMTTSSDGTPTQAEFEVRYGRERLPADHWAAQVLQDSGVTEALEAVTTTASEIEDAFFSAKSHLTPGQFFDKHGYFRTDSRDRTGDDQLGEAAHQYTSAIVSVDTREFELSQAKAALHIAEQNLRSAENCLGNRWRDLESLLEPKTYDV